MHNYYLMLSVGGMLLEIYNKMAIIAQSRIHLKIRKRKVNVLM